MQTSSGQKVSDAPPTTQQTSDKKRKRQDVPLPAVADPTSLPAAQQPFQSFFSTTQEPKTTTIDLVRDGSATSAKRTRVDSSRSQPQQMYSFINQTSPSNVITLSESPPRAGQRRRSSVLKPITTPLNPQQGAKKLLVKNLKKQSDWDPEEYFTKTWKRLDDAITNVLQDPHARITLEDLYRCVETLCRQGKASSINSRLNERLTKHLRSTVLPSLQEQANSSAAELLQAVIAAWSTWSTQVTLIRGIFYYMDRSYLLSHSKMNLLDVCVNHFRSNIFENPHLRDKTVEGACDLFAREREEQDVDKTALLEAVRFFHSLSAYSSAFEPRFLAITQAYIIQWADKTSSQKELPEYIQDARKVMGREIERCESYALDTSTRREALSLLEGYIIEQKADYLTNDDAVADLLDTYDVSSLELLYTLLKRRKLGARLKKPFSKWVDLIGTSIIFDDKAQEDMVVKLLSLKRSLDHIWDKCFQRDTEIGHGLRESFEAFMNKVKKGQSTWGTDNSKTGEMIAKYVDLLLRGGSRAIPSELTAAKVAPTEEKEEDDDAGIDEDAEINAQLDQVLDLFRFIHGKAVFEAFYKKDLAKRLLMGRSASADAERSMLTRLKTECGAGFTQNLEQMFKDIELGREEMSAYKDRLESMQSKPGSIDLSVNVLSAAAWPTYPEIPVVIPADVNTAIEHFEQYYKVKHSGRKLSWKHSLAHCQVKANFPKGVKEFVVSSFQAIILLLFNGVPSGQKLSYDHIKTVSGLPEAEVKRTLQSLACAKLRPLSKYPVGKEINDDDQFSINASFSHPRYRVRINQVQLKETKQENKETHERVAEDRNFECQAAVVRIMKSRKTIGHSELVAEVITATRSRGVLAVADIKKNIDRLIEKEYMEREEGNTYSYVA